MRWLARSVCGLVIVGACLGARPARAEVSTLRLMMHRPDAMRFEAGLRQQLAGREVRLELAEPPRGDTREQRLAAVLAALPETDATTVLWLEAGAAGELALFALSSCGVTRSAPLDPPPGASSTRRVWGIVAESLVEELAAASPHDERGRCTPAAPETPRTSHDQAFDAERPPVARSRSRDVIADSAAAQMPTWVPIVGLVAAGGLGLAAYLTWPEAGASQPSDAAASSETGPAGQGPSSAVPAAEAPAGSRPATLSYVLGASAVAMGVASVALIVVAGAEPVPEGHAARELGLGVTPTGASISVTRSF